MSKETNEVLEGKREGTSVVFGIQERAARKQRSKHEVRRVPWKDGISKAL